MSVRSGTSRRSARRVPIEPRVHMVGSLGGHISLLVDAARSFDGIAITWITSDGPRADALRQDGQDVRTLPRLDRRSMSVRSIGAGVALAIRERPRTVVTSGAGIAVPFCLLARVMGARIIFIETMARVTAPSKTGRVLKRICFAVIVQWPQLVAHYPEAHVCAPALIDGVEYAGGTTGTGTFVTLGTHDRPFDRLLDAVADAAAKGILPTPVFIQGGASARAIPGCVCEDYVSPTEFYRRLEEARVVVTHGGAAAIGAALRAGKKPIVMSRHHRFAEHVDDHQSQIVAQTASAHLVVPLDKSLTVGHIDETARRSSVPALWTTPPDLGRTLRLLLDRALQR